MKQQQTKEQIALLEEFAELRRCSTRIVLHVFLYALYVLIFYVLQNILQL